MVSIRFVEGMMKTPYLCFGFISPIVGELFDSVVLLLILLAVQKSTDEDGEKASKSTT